MDTLPPGVDLCAIPAAAPPEGHIPNFANPVDLSVETLAVGAVFTVVATIYFVGRLYTNRNRMKWADYLTIIGFCMSAAYTGIIMALYPYARHQYDMPACWYTTDHIWKLLFAQNMLLGLTQFFVKAAILVVFFQLFAVNKKMRWVIYSGVIFSGLIYLPHPILVAIFNTPRAGERWADLATNGRPQMLTFYAPIHGFGSVILDIFIFLVPLLILGKLHVPTKKRLQLMAVFAVGILGIISSIFSCYWRMDMLVSSNTDYTWRQAQLFIWIMVEHNAALIAGSMPAVAAFVRTNVAGSTFVSSLRSRTFRTTKGSKGSKGETSLRSHEVSLKSDLHRSGHRSRSYYHELDDVPNDAQALVRTDITVAPGMEEVAWPMSAQGSGGILRTTDLSQTSYLPTAK